MFKTTKTHKFLRPGNTGGDLLLLFLITSHHPYKHPYVATLTLCTPLTPPIPITQSLTPPLTPLQHITTHPIPHSRDTCSFPQSIRRLLENLKERRWWFAVWRNDESPSFSRCKCVFSISRKIGFQYLTGGWGSLWPGDEGKGLRNGAWGREKGDEGEGVDVGRV